jgi:hypothetical protein
MSDIFSEAYSAAQKATGPERWERVSDTERMRAIYEQICRMDTRQVENWLLFEDCAVRSRGKLFA